MLTVVCSKKGYTVNQFYLVSNELFLLVARTAIAFKLTIRCEQVFVVVNAKQPE